MKIAILDYNDGAVIVTDIPKNIAEDSELTESWLDEQGYRLSEINWLVSKNLIVDIH